MTTPSYLPRTRFTAKAVQMRNLLQSVVNGVQWIKSLRHVPRWTAGRLEYETGIHLGWWYVLFISSIIGGVAAMLSVMLFRSYYEDRPVRGVAAVAQDDADGHGDLPSSRRSGE